ncbi:hypothetical protein [Clostridium sp. AM49-4BH]|uniref:hypothetical protein n=1 Tax=Clostridium sp. AM49-4BH TaxID=2293035 RepID=UPI000E517209|nr:hypothetical protein [Clostridium sp. AM49-4BH]RHQ12350.1 hypothetical protein DW981_08465 [Clostridium sp. AM49-4BH]
MKRLKNWIREFWDDHFAKVQCIPNIMVIPFNLDGRLILRVTKDYFSGEMDSKTYLIEHLLDEDFNITEETLQMEKEHFIVPFRSAENGKLEQWLDEKTLGEYKKIVVETDEENPTTIATITPNARNAITGYRVRMIPVYEKAGEK